MKSTIFLSVMSLFSIAGTALAAPTADLVEVVARNPDEVSSAEAVPGFVTESIPLLLHLNLC